MVRNLARRVALHELVLRAVTATSSSRMRWAACHKNCNLEHYRFCRARFIGGAAVGLYSLRARAGGPEDPPLRSPAGVEADLQVRLNENEQKYLRPEPRIRAGLLLGRTRAASACIDLSDGLADGLRQIAGASGVGITVDEAAIPMADGVAEFHRTRAADALCAALAGGDDYELLFTARSAWRGRLRAVRRQVGDLPITKIGVVTSDRQVILRSAAGDRNLPAGFEHFR